MNSTFQPVRSSRLALVGVGLMAMFLSGCIGGRQVTMGPPTAEFVGVLRGGQAEGHGWVDCYWLEGPSGERQIVLYEDGWEVLFDPTRLVDGSGNVVAEEGDVVRVTGTLDATGQSLCLVGPTRTGPIIGAERVELVAGG